MKIPEELEPVVQWWEMHGKETVATLAVAALAAIAVFAYNLRKERRRDAAADALSASVNASLAAMLDSSSPSAVQSVQDIRAAIEARPDAKNAPVMKLLLASAYLARRDESGAKSALEIYDALSAPGATPGAYADIPKVGRAQCLEALGRFDEALEEFDGFAAGNPGSFLALAAKLGAARSLAQSGRKDEAIARLEALKKDAKDVDLQAVEFTLALVKRWVPASERIPAPPAAEPKAAVEEAMKEVEGADAPAPEAPAAEVPEAPAAAAEPPETPPEKDAKE